MLLWISLIGGLGLAAAAVGLLVAMRHAERRARRTLFRALGLDDATVDLLMARNGDVLAELALVRRQDLPPETAAPKAGRAKSSIRLVHPPADDAAHAPAPGDLGRPAGERRRLRLPGRS